MHVSYTRNDIAKALKKTIKHEFIGVLPLPMADNCFYTREDILKTVMFSITEDVYVAYGSQRLQEHRTNIPSDDTIFHHLNTLTVNTVFASFQQVNTMLLHQAAHNGVFGTPLECSVDIHKNPWYGTARDIHVLGMERVRGTNYGHGYASIECVNTKARLTLAALPLHQFTTNRQIIDFLVTEARLWANISRLFLDRGFFDMDSVDTLSRLDVLFVIPAIHNAKVKALITAAHYQSEQIPGTDCYAWITPYTMTKGKHSTTVTLVVILSPPKKPGEPLDEFAYITNIPVTLGDALELAESYRHRWGIETGYRVKEQVRGRTCSRHYPVRLLFQLLSILLYNLWQLCNLDVSGYLHWEKRTYVVILPRFKDIIADILLRG